MLPNHPTSWVSMCKWVSLKLDFFGRMKICVAYQSSGLSILIYMKLYKEKEKNNFEQNSRLSRKPAEPLHGLSRTHLQKVPLQTSKLPIQLGAHMHISVHDLSYDLQHFQYISCFKMWAFITVLFLMSNCLMQPATQPISNTHIL